MQTTEQVDDGIEALGDLHIGDAFQPRAELSVRELGDVNRRELLLVHKLLE